MRTFESAQTGADGRVHHVGRVELTEQAHRELINEKHGLKRACNDAVARYNETRCAYERIAVEYVDLLIAVDELRAQIAEIAGTPAQGPTTAGSSAGTLRDIYPVTGRTSAS